ncbi:MAG: DUF2007 domain-containing protein [Alphaproteobacteria bacterium]|nr:DUF2007 domain-containing protein [Alphaproteobacteria bacterium]
MAGLVLLGSFASLAEAQVARATLDAHGIPSFLFDENLHGNLFPSVALFGARLMVPEDRLEEAALLLDAPRDPSQ